MKNPIIFDNKPTKVELEKGNDYYFCKCGLSKNQPFCDGNHDFTGMRPIFVEITEEKTVAWCGCKISENKPYCDGSHKKYQED